MREGTIHRDPAYRRFLENIEKPVEVSVPAWVASCFPLSTVALTRALWGCTQKLPSAELQQDAAGEPDEYEIERKVVETALVAYLMQKRSSAREARRAVRMLPWRR